MQFENEDVYYKEGKKIQTIKALREKVIAP